VFRQATIAAMFFIGTSVARADPLDKPVTGPKLICFKYSTFILAGGESITDFSGSPEAMSIIVDSPSGEFTIGESEIFAPAKGPKRLVFSNGRTSVYRISDQGDRYAIYGPTSFSAGKDRLVIRLRGQRLNGDRRDEGVFNRFEVRDLTALKCEQIFTYSWGIKEDMSAIGGGDGPGQ